MVSVDQIEEKKLHFMSKMSEFSYPSEIISLPMSSPGTIELEFRYVTKIEHDVQSANSVLRSLDISLRNQNFPIAN